jgi:hypothetical protein
MAAAAPQALPAAQPRAFPSRREDARLTFFLATAVKLAVAPLDRAKILLQCQSTLVWA